MAELLVTPRRRRTTVMVAVVVVLFTCSQCGQDAPTVDQAIGPEVVATVDGNAVAVADVVALLPEDEPVRLGSAPPPDPVRQALETAVRRRLFAREAQHRDLVSEPSGSLVGLDAQRVQALLADERARYGLTVEAITDAEARQAYEHRRHEFDEIERVEVLWAVVDDLGQAEQLLAVDGASEAEFRRQAAGVSDGVHRAEIDAKGNGGDLTLARVALALGTTGRVGMGRGDDGRYYVARASSVDLESRPWDPSLSMLVRTALAWERENDHLTQLGDELAMRWPVRIEEERLDEITAAWERGRASRLQEAPRPS